MRRMPVRLTIVVLAIYVVLLAPIAVVLGVSFNPRSRLAIDFGGVSWRWYRAFFESGPFMDSLVRVSLPVALAAAALSLAIGTLAAVGMAGWRGRGRAAMEAVFMLPLLVPSILLGVALYLAFVMLGVTPGFLSLVVSHTLLGTPFVIRVVGAGLVGIDKRLGEAAQTLGYSPRQAFLRVTLPLMRSSLISAALFAFIESFSDVNLALFLAGPQTTPLPLHIFSEISWEGSPIVAAASGVQIVVVSLLVLVVQRAFRVRSVA